MSDLREWFLWTPCCGRARRPVLCTSGDLSRLYDEHLRYCPRAFAKNLRPGQRQLQPVDAPHDDAAELDDDGMFGDEGALVIEDDGEPRYIDVEYQPWSGRGVIDVYLPDDLSDLQPAPPRAPGSAAERAQALADNLDMKGNTHGQKP